MGVVEKYEFKSGEKTYSVEVRLATNFRKLRHAFVVKICYEKSLINYVLKRGWKMANEIVRQILRFLFLVAVQGLILKMLSPAHSLIRFYMCCS